MTGAPVPLSADTVIRREDVTENADNIVLTIDSIKPHQSIAPQGQDVILGDLLLGKSTKIKPATLGALAVVGKTEVLVEKLPSVVIFSTGDEVVADNTQILPHQIRESNSIVLTAMLSKYGIKDVLHIHLPDDKSISKTKIKSQLDKDIIIITGGISMGDADYIPEVLEELGVEKIIQKVAIRPGKPFWFGRDTSGSTIFALPGNPISAQAKERKVNLDEFFPCVYNHSPFGLKATSFNTSGDITSTAISDGIAIHPVDNEKIKEGEFVDFIPW
jgi:molybdopterin molybdotransferase